jgi:thioredoxin 1
MSMRSVLPSALFGMIFVSVCTHAMAPPAFDGVDKWKGLLTTTGVESLNTLYSTDPPARFIAGQKAEPDISPEINFWQKLVSSGAYDFQANLVEEDDRQGLHLVTLAVSLKVKTPDGSRTRYVTEQQAWQQQGNEWRILLAGHSDLVKMPPALHADRNLYKNDAEANTEIREATAKAQKEHQRVILVFGANWCYDCHVLDQAFHQADIAALLQKGFQVVHVDIGDDGKKNSDIAKQYDVPLDRGIPALAVLDSDGKLLYSQKQGEWESARSLDPDDVVAFLKKWQP